jgi:hypothetical protein
MVDLLINILEEDKKENQNLFNPNFANTPSNINNNEIMEKKKIFIKNSRVKKILKDDKTV